ncbi:MAG: hypothetical protein E6G62_10650 [Actinobacteria bacterium]|nr:MAG: hypothetical protein E6G62_10650 [Actinomycetota bacterium]
MFQPGASVSGVADGGSGGDDSVVITGRPDTVVSTPTGPQSGIIVENGTTTIVYAGMEPIDVSGANIVIGGGEDGNPSPIPQGDLFQVSPYTDPASPTVACQTPGNCIQVQNFDAPTGLIPAAELSYFVIAGTLSLTLNGGPGSDKTEFMGDYLVPGSTLTVNTESIKIDSGVTVDVGTGDVFFNAASADDGTEAAGIDTTLLGDGGSIELDGAVLNGHTISLVASSTNASTTVNGAGQNLTGAGDTLIVATTTPFLSTGKFMVPGVTGTCSFTGTSDRTKFTGVSGCTGTPADGAAVASLGILENGSGKGINHAALQLIYSATIDVHGASTISATGDVTLSSTVGVVATANSAGLDKGTWTSGTDYDKGDVVTDPADNKRYAAKNDVHPSTMSPSGDSTNWDDVDSKDSSVTAAQVAATAKSQLSDMSSIATPTGIVQITSAVTTNITSIADSSLAGSGAGISVAVLTTDSEAFVDSSAATPVDAASLTVSATTDNTAPTTGKASPRGARGNDESANSSHRANGNSKTSDGTADLAAALAVTVLVSTTKAYVEPGDALSTHTLHTTGAQLFHAGTKNAITAEADGSPADGTTSGAVGIAVGVTVAAVTTDAHLANNAVLHASSVTVEAEAPGTSTFTTHATSGAGDGSSTGVAGALAVGVLVASTTARVSGAAPVAADSGLTFAAHSDNASSATAEAKTTAGTATGVGASVALNVVDDTTSAGIGAGAALTGASSFSASSTSTSAVTTTAAGGAAGGTAVAPVVGISIVNVSTSSALGAGPALIVDGDVTLTATQTGTVTTTATGAASGSTAVGAAIALTVANHSVSAGNDRDLTSTGGAVGFHSTGTWTTATHATASASGGPSDGSGSPNVDSQSASQRGFADDQAAANGAGGSGGTSTPSASTSGGSVSVAAAIAIDIANAESAGWRTTSPLRTGARRPVAPASAPPSRSPS